MVTKLDWSTPARDILLQCGWLSVNQLVIYHSVLLICKVKQNHTTKYLDNMFSWSYQYKTRQAESGQIKVEGRPRLELTRSSFRWRAADQFNLLPATIRNCENIITFKLKAKAWIRNNVSLSG